MFGCSDCAVFYVCMLVHTCLSLRKAYTQRCPSSSYLAPWTNMCSDEGRQGANMDDGWKNDL